MMRRNSVCGLFVLFAMLANAGVVRAQEATLSGTVRDTTGGGMPGVTVTAVHEATGNRFTTVTDVQGQFRASVRIGAYRIVAELSGFATVERRGVELLVGQQATVNIEMSVAALDEVVTVSAEAPLIERAISTVGSNVDQRQMEELPLNGRNFVDLTMLAPGSRQNASSDELGGLGLFQLNVDGLRVTQNQTAGFGQPKYSRDAIAEFQFITNRFDATQGGSSGTMVNAITKSGTNAFAGTLSGYFRDDRFIAKDFIADRVLPYSDTQLSATFGGPILRDRLHFFGSYEHELEPQTFTHTSQWSAFNFDHSGTRTEKKGFGRGDIQFTPDTRMSVRGNVSRVWMPYDARYTGGATRHPSSTIATARNSGDISATVTRTLAGGRALNEFRGSYTSYYWIQQSIVPWPDHPYPALPTEPLRFGTPIIQFRGYTVGQAHTNSHEDERQWTVAFRNNLSFSFTKGGRHDVKLGGEYAYQQNPTFLCNRCMGIYDAGGGPVPSNLPDLFPVWNDVSTWNLAAISPLVRSYTLGVGQMLVYAPLNMFSGWIQDDWQVAPRLTLNLGVRYDFQTGVYAEDVELEPFLEAGRPNDKNNLAPRVGAAFSLTPNTVLRGGAGRFFADPGSHTAYWTMLGAYALHPQILNDGRPDFAANPFNGPVPTFDEVAATLCTVNPAPGCLRRSIGTFAAPENEIPYSNQASAGFQRQLNRTMALEMDYVYTGLRAQNYSMNVNQAYDPETGVNYPFNQVNKRPHPDWGSVTNRLSVGQSNYHGLQMGFTKRMSQRWQASATYLYAKQFDLQNAPVPVGCQYPITLDPASGVGRCDVAFDLHPALAEEWYLNGDQRHRFTFNGIWDLGLGIQLSGLYLYGDNGWATPTSGLDALQTGSSSGPVSRVRANGTLIARNSFDLPSIHRVDMRAQKRFAVGPARVDGIVEVFNVLNRENFGSFTLNESNASFGRPTQNLNVAYQPRTLQLGFRVAF
jgi:hypothetical protein